MPRRSHASVYSGYYYGYGRRDGQRRFANPLPYLIVALLAVGGLAYFRFVVYKSLSGDVLNGYTGAPVAGVVVAVAAATPATAGSTTISPTLALTSTTGIDGSFAFARVPANPVVSVAAEGFGPQRVDVADLRHIDIKLVPNVLQGRVTTPDAKPVPAAVILAGNTRTVSGPDGTYLLKDIPPGRNLVVKAPGYRSTSLSVGRVVTQNITLTPFVARAIYISADTVATPGKLQALLDLVKRTELDAVVIDVKADNTGHILYDSKLPEANQLGTVRQLIPDLNGLLADLKARGIYAIARMPVFWDQALTSAKPEWALKSKKNPGKEWVDSYGKRWSNPYSPEVWDYNIGIAKEVAQRGFDEVQFDSLQFPSDGDLADIDYGAAAAGKKRADAIADFLNRAYAELSPMGTYVAADLFGLTGYVQDDMGVGQHFEDVAAHVDYVCLSIYPSHFGDGFNGYPKPAEHPGEIVSETMKASVPRLAGTAARIRPWLQAFDGTKIPYDQAKVRAEIDAAEQNGAVGWMLWNFGNDYPGGALKGK